MTPEREARIRAVLNRRQPDLTVLMDQVHKPHNLAAIARTCDAVGVLELHAVPVTGGVRLTRNRAASGAGKWLPVRRHADIPAAYAHLRAAGCQLLCAHFTPGACDYRDIDYTRPTALVVGSELEGLSARAITECDRAVTVPMLGMTQSLNVSVATALILYEALRQRQAAGAYERPALAPAAYAAWLERWAEN